MTALFAQLQKGQLESKYEDHSSTKRHEHDPEHSGVLIPFALHIERLTTGDKIEHVSIPPSATNNTEKYVFVNISIDFPSLLWYFHVMLSYNELKPGTVFVWKGEPWLVLEYQFLRMQQRKPVARTKIRNLKSGKVLDQTFHYSDEFEEADVSRKPVKYLYNNRGEYWFSEIKDPSKRFSLEESLIGAVGKFMKPNSEVTAILFEENIMGVESPIKVELEVKETPPAIKGATAAGGNKPATLETGATVNVPMFINAGDVIRVNTQTGEYVERTEKATGI